MLFTSVVSVALSIAPSILATAIGARKPNLSASKDKRQGPDFLIYACNGVDLTGDCHILSLWSLDGFCADLPVSYNDTIVSLVSTSQSVTCYLYNDPGCPGDDALILTGLEKKVNLMDSDPSYASSISSFFCFNS
jgi:hypothetical protein